MPLKRTTPREVTNIIGSKEVIRMTTGTDKKAEIRQKTSGEWSVFYPDPGFTPCNCSKACLAETRNGPKMIESHFRGTQEEALAECYALGYTEPKVIEAETRSERMKRIHAERANLASN